MEGKEEKSPAEVVQNITQFREKVLTTLVRLEDGQKGITDHLGKMNGTQSNLIEKVAALEIFREVHPQTCVFGKSLDELKETIREHLIVRKTEDQMNKKWLARLKPYILLLVGAGIAILLTHIDQWIKLIK